MCTEFHFSGYGRLIRYAVLRKLSFLGSSKFASFLVNDARALLAEYILEFVPRDFAVISAIRKDGSYIENNMRLFKFIFKSSRME